MAAAQRIAGVLRVIAADAGTEDDGYTADVLKDAAELLELLAADREIWRDAYLRRLEADLRLVDRRNQPNWTPETERNYRQWVADMYWRRAEEARHDGA